MKRRTKNISTAAIKDAIATAYGPYSMNAPSAWGYGFCVESAQSKTVAWGEFLYDAADKFDGAIDYNGDVLVDIASGETIDLKAAFAKGMQ
jgi:hypothetical protein